MGMVVGGPDGRGGDLEKNPPMMKYSVTQRKKATATLQLAVGVLPSLRAHSSSCLYSISVCSLSPVSSSVALLLPSFLFMNSLLPC